VAAAALPTEPQSPASLLGAVEKGDFDGHLAAKNPTVNVLHFSQTGRLTPDVEKLIRALHARGFHVEGRLYDRPKFDERAEAVAKAEETAVVAGPAKPEDAPARPTFLQRVRSFADRVFGLRGFTMLTFPFNPTEKLKSVRARALLAGNLLLGARLALQEQFFYGVPMVVLNAWIFGYVSNAKELYQFKSQGAAVRVADDGSIFVKANYPMLATGTFLEELAITMLLRTSVGGPAAVAGDPLGVLVDAGVTGLAKATTDAPISDLYRRSELAKKAGNAAEAEELEARAEMYQDVLYNLVFPILKFMQLPIPSSDPTIQMGSLIARTVSNGILLSMGFYGLVREGVKKYFSRPTADANCATVLYFSGAKEKAEAVATAAAF